MSVQPATLARFATGPCLRFFFLACFVAGLFVTGLGISLQFPLAITRAIGFSDGRADQATAYASLGTGFAIGMAPFGLGALADHVGSHTAILTVPVFAILAAVGVATTRRAALPPAGPSPRAVGRVPSSVD